MVKTLQYFTFFSIFFFINSNIDASEKTSWFHRYNPAAIYRDRMQHHSVGMEKIPVFWKTGYHQHGRYDQFTIDRRAALEALSAGLMVRFLYCCGHFGTKLETIKSAILIPGAAKAVLYWGVSCAVYKYRKSQHARIDLESEIQKLAQQHADGKNTEK